MIPWFLLDILRDCGKKVNVGVQNHANVALDFVRGTWTIRTKTALKSC